MSNRLTQTFTSFRKRQEAGVFEHKARALLTPPRDAREQPVKIHGIRRQLSLKIATDGGGTEATNVRVEGAGRLPPRDARTRGILHSLRARLN
jgi:hypothetical protein